MLLPREGFGFRASMVLPREGLGFRVSGLRFRV